MRVSLSTALRRRTRVAFGNDKGKAIYYNMRIPRVLGYKIVKELKENQEGR